MHWWGPAGLGSVLGAWFAPTWGIDSAMAMVMVWVAVGGLLLYPRVGEPWAGAARTAMIGLAGIGTGWLSVSSQPVGPHLRGPVTLVGVTVAHEGGSRILVEATRTRTSDTPWRDARGRVRVRWRGTPPPLGSHVAAFGLADAPRSPAMPGAPSPALTDARARIRTTLRARTAHALGPPPPAKPKRDVPGLLRALSQGDRSQLSPELIRTLRLTGTAHLLAISGFHVGTIAAVAAWLARRLTATWALLDPAGPPEHLGHVAAVVAATLFTWSVGAPVSAQRACAMVALVAWAHRTGRAHDGLSILGLVATSMVCFDPSVVTRVSFQLSFGAVWGLLTWGPAFERLVPPDLPTPISLMLRGMLTSIAATIGTLPASAWWFQQLSPTSPLANLLAMPLASLVLVPSAMLATWAPDPLGPLAIWVGEAATTLLQAMLDPLAITPLAPAVAEPGALALFGLMPLARYPRVACWLALICLGLRAEHHGRLVLTFPDIGHGDAVLIHHPDGRRELVDTGDRWAGVTSWLRRRGTRRLDTLTITHGDADHAGGAVDVLEACRVGELRTASPADIPEVSAAAHRLGVTLATTADLRLWPPSEIPPEDPNGRSWVSVVEHRAHAALLTGDIGTEQEAALLQTLEPVALLKLPHHGSKTSTSDALLDVTHPCLAVAQLGPHGRYDHPHVSVLRRLAAHGVPLWRTDLHGTIEVAFDAEAIWLRTYGRDRHWSPWQHVPTASCGRATHHDLAPTSWPFQALREHSPPVTAAPTG